LPPWAIARIERAAIRSYDDFLRTGPWPFGPPHCCPAIHVMSLAVFQPDHTPTPMLLMGTAGGVPLWSTQFSIPMLDFKIQKIED
jgi:hypothetical protein